MELLIIIVISVLLPIKINKMKLSISLFAFFLYIFSYSQVDVKKSSISTGGGSASVGTTQIIYSIGEVTVQENAQGNIHLSEGFIGPDIAGLVGIEDYGYLENIKVFPNPVKNRIQITLPGIGNYEVYIFDLNGKELMRQDVSDTSQLSYDLYRYQTGVYLLLIIDRQKHLSAHIKLQKL